MSRKRKANITPNDVNTFYIDDNENIYRLTRCDMEPLACMLSVSKGGLLEKPISEFANFIRLKPERPITELPKPRKPRADKGKTHKKNEPKGENLPPRGEPLGLDLPRPLDYSNSLTSTTKEKEEEMKGILFQPWKIKAIAECGFDREWQTRRVINPQPGDKIWQETFPGGIVAWKSNKRHEYGDSTAHFPRYQVGEVVYIKEAWHYLNIEENKATPYDFGIEFADGEILWWTDNGNEMNYPLDEKKRSPMFLKAKFARYFLKILDVRPERLQEITEEDAIAEGIYKGGNYFSDNVHEAVDDTACLAYKRLWDSINPNHPWASNSWVWRYEFKFLIKEG